MPELEATQLKGERHPDHSAAKPRDLTGADSRHEVSTEPSRLSALSTLQLRGTNGLRAGRRNPLEAASST